MEEPSADALLENLTCDIQEWDMCDWEADLIQDLVESLSLANRSGNTVKDEAIWTGMLDRGFHDLHDRVIIYELASLHDVFDAFTELCACTDFLPQSIASADVGQLEIIDKFSTLCPLSGAWWAEKDDVQWFYGHNQQKCENCKVAVDYNHSEKVRCLLGERSQFDYYGFRKATRSVRKLNELYGQVVFVRKCSNTLQNGVIYKQ